MEAQTKPHTMDKYIYTPLNSDKNELRLLRLMPLSASSNIEIKIFHADTTSNPQYEALSYAWGSPERTNFVYVKGALPENGSPERQLKRLCSGTSTHLDITRNLWIALSHLRLLDKARVLWIDSICINQDDIDERSREVRKMGDIFHQARRVVVWLGEETPENSLAIPTLKSIGEGIELSISSSGRTLYDVKPGSEALRLESSPQAEKAKSPNWIAIRSLLGASWFTRLWTFQEIILARDAIFVDGTHTIELEVFRAALSWIHEQRDNDKSQRTITRILDSKVMKATKPFLGQRQLKDLDYAMALFNVYHIVRELNCFDPRDCIYAILSLLEKEYQTAIIPDYTKTIEEVFMEAVLLDTEITCDLNILYHCNFANHQWDLKLPSWVPNLSKPSLTEFLGPSFPSGHSQQETEYLETSKALRVRGKLACTIKHIDTPIPISATIEEILAICLTWEPPDASRKSYITGGTLIDAFIATIFTAGTSEFSRFETPELFKTEALRNAYNSVIINRLIPPEMDLLVLDFLFYLPGRTFFTTEEGLIGLCSASARPGDLAFTALGCANPLVLRKDLQREDHFQVGGVCYIHGLSGGAGILGPLPSGWSYRLILPRGYERPCFTSPEGRDTQDDPRAGPLPSAWSMWYLGEREGEWYTDEIDEIDEIDENGNIRAMCFHNETTEELTYFDPRLTSENLKTLGIDLQDIFLV